MTNATKAAEASEKLTETADYFAATLAVADPRAWRQLLIYCPPELRALPAETPDQGEALRTALNGARELPLDRDTLGRAVREAWVRWAYMQPDPKASWLVPYDELSDEDKEADRQIGETVARWTLIHDAARLAILDVATPAPDERRSAADGDQAARTLARDAARWRALVTTFGPEADVSSSHRPHTMLIAIDTEGCEVREDGRLNFKETLERALDDEIRMQSRLISPPAPPKPPAVKETE